MNKIKTHSILAMIIFAIVMSVSFSSCDKDGNLLIEEEELITVLGWLFDGATEENHEEIEDDVVIDPEPVDPNELPSSTSMLANFPPIGDQGQYGTCVSWAVGYNLRTAIEAQAKGYSSADLQDPSKQFSPKYLFWAIPNNLKGGSCNGTNFEYAFDVMLSSGVATEATVPYQSLGDCSSSTQASWDNEAKDFKIDNYREIPELAENSQVDADTKINLLKKYLAQGRPIAFGARLGDNFMQWNSDDVLSSDTYAYNGQHSYHAMTLSGYDNNKGFGGGAFEIVNSWNNTWGNSGRIWIDYDFFVEEFCFAAFVAAIEPGVGYNPEEDASSGKDLIAWDLLDEINPEGNNSLDRVITYDVFNIGQEVIHASEDWNISYVIYNAYNANEYDILVYDYYSDDYGNYGEDGILTEDMGDIYGLAANWWNHIDVPADASVAETLYGEEGVSFLFPYTIPEYTGDYYLVLIADGFDNVSESDETNNYFYFTGADGEPLKIENGIIMGNKMNLKNMQSGSKPKKGDRSPAPTARTQQNLNTYRPHLIQQVIESHKSTGEWQERLNSFKTERSAAKKYKVKK